MSQTKESTSLSTRAVSKIHRERKEVMTTLHQAPLGLRTYFSSFIAFFLVVYSISLFYNEINPPLPLVAKESDEPNEKIVEQIIGNTSGGGRSSDSSGSGKRIADNIIDGGDSGGSTGEQVVEQIVASTASGSDSGGGGDSGGVEENATCNWFDGRWVYDKATRPLYSGPACKFMHDEVACDKYGRKDLMYQHWRWQPHGCDLPRFDAERLLEKLRNKRLVFVGDSLNRNQWVSMICMVESVVPAEHKTRTFNGSLMSFKVMTYNVSIDFYWSPLLVESNCDNPIIHRVSSRIMKAYKMENHAKNWINADLLVFNSYLWWKKPNMKMKVMYGTFEDGDAVLEQVEMFQGFELALKSWSQYLEKNLNNMNARLFFVSLSPTHVWGGEWGAEGPDRSCYGETEPVYKEGYRSSGSDYEMMHRTEEIIENLKFKGVNVQIINITQLSEYRKDGHPSIYRRQYVKLTEKQLANPSSYADCTHWCLPGVPDVWNELLYAHIVSQ